MLFYKQHYFIFKKSLFYKYVCFINNVFLYITLFYKKHYLMDVSVSLVSALNPPCVLIFLSNHSTRQNELQPSKHQALNQSSNKQSAELLTTCALTVKCFDHSGALTIGALSTYKNHTNKHRYHFYGCQLRPEERTGNKTSKFSAKEN